MLLSSRRLLFVGAHPDDIELGAGALVHQAVSQSDVRCVTLSKNRAELSHLVAEHSRSMNRLGVHADRVQLESFETRRFHERRQDILDLFLRLRRELDPEIVFVHSRFDIHQDHNIVTAEALRAFRGTTILGFEILRSSQGFFPQLLLEVSEENVEAKLAALREYGTYRETSYFQPDVVRSSLLRNGELAGRRFAEGFEVIRGVARLSG